MRSAGVLLGFFMIACGASPGTGDAGTFMQQDAGPSGPVDSGTVVDAGPKVDAGPNADAGPSMDAGACYTNCINQNMAAYAVFDNDELNQCGCQSGAACASECTTECSASPMTFPTDSSPCGTCINNQENLGMSSGCTSAAGFQCLTQNNCSAFVSCSENCP